MTQPVQEPSQGRIDAGQEFRSRQLFRRPAPPSAVGGGEAKYAYVSNFTTESVTGSSLRLSSENFWTNDDTIFSTGGVTTPGVNAPGDLYLHFARAGHYRIYMDVFWDNTSAYVRDSWLDTTCVVFQQNELTANAAWYGPVGAGQSDPLQWRDMDAFVSQYTLDHSPSFHFRASVVVFNRDGGTDHDVLYHSLAAVWWPMDNNFQNAPDTDMVY